MCKHADFTDLMMKPQGLVPRFCAGFALREGGLTPSGSMGAPPAETGGQNPAFDHALKT